MECSDWSELWPFGATGRYDRLNDKALTSQRTPKDGRVGARPSRLRNGHNACNFCGVAANLAGIRHAPDDPPRFQRPAVRPDSG